MTDSNQLAGAPEVIRAPPLWCKNGNGYEVTIAGLTEEMRDYCDFVALTPAEHAARELVVKKVSSLVASSFWGCRAEVELFGSFSTGLCLPWSDVDLSIRAPVQPRMISDLSHLLETEGFTCRYIPTSKVPVLKFSHGETQILGDISFCVSNAYQSAELIREFLRSLPAAKPLVLIIKSMLRVAELNNVYTGGLSSYAVTLSVISFLQMHPYYKNLKMRDSYSIGDLLIDYLLFYGKDFNYTSTRISVRDGGTYVLKMPQWGSWGAFQKIALSIIDPLDAGNDVAIGSFNMLKVKQLFLNGYNILLASKQKKCNLTGSLLENLLRPEVMLNLGLLGEKRTGRRHPSPAPIPRGESFIPSIKHDFGKSCEDMSERTSQGEISGEECSSVTSPRYTEETDVRSEISPGFNDEDSGRSETSPVSEVDTDAPPPTPCTSMASALEAVLMPTPEANENEISIEIHDDSIQTQEHPPVVAPVTCAARDEDQEEVLNQTEQKENEQNKQDPVHETS